MVAVGVAAFVVLGLVAFAVVWAACAAGGDADRRQEGTFD